MRFIYLQHIPYRHLPGDFAARFPESVITTPYFDIAEPRSYMPTYGQDSMRRCTLRAQASTRSG